MLSKKFKLKIKINDANDTSLWLIKYSLNSVLPIALEISVKAKDLQSFTEACMEVLSICYKINGRNVPTIEQDEIREALNSIYTRSKEAFAPKPIKPAVTKEKVLSFFTEFINEFINSIESAICPNIRYMGGK